MRGLRELMDERPVFGTFVKLPRPEVVDVLAAVGFDFVVVDGEHAQVGVAELLATVRAAVAAGLPTLVRVPDLDRGLINRLLEAGACGIQLARGEGCTAVELSQLVRYPPAGTRSVSLAQPAARYGREPIVTYLAGHNAGVLAVGQFETREYALDLDTAVSGLDVVFIGPTDLSVDLGHPGELDAQPVRAAMVAIEQAAQRAHVPLGTFAAGPEEAKAAVARGHRYLVVSSDLGMLMTEAAALQNLLFCNTR